MAAPRLLCGTRQTTNRPGRAASGAIKYGSVRHPVVSICLLPIVRPAPDVPCGIERILCWWGLQLFRPCERGFGRAVMQSAGSESAITDCSASEAEQDIRKKWRRRTSCIRPYQSSRQGFHVAVVSYKVPGLRAKHKAGFL